MIGDAWVEMVVAEAADLEGANWRDRLETRAREAAERWNDGRLDDDGYTRVTTAIGERFGRTRRAADRKTDLRVVQGKATGGRIGGLAMPMVNAARPAPASPPAKTTARKGGIRYSVLERLDRYRQRLRYHWHRYHAARAMLPAEISDAFGIAEAGALRFVLLDAHAAGVCRRGLNHIAKAAQCSRRTVQSAIRLAAALSLLTVAETPGKTHVITVIDARAAKWAANAAAYGQAHHPFGREKNQQEEGEEGPPHTLASACTTPSDRCDDEPVDGPQEPLAILPAAKPPRLSGANVAHPSGVAPSEPTAGPLDALISRLRSAVADHARSSEYRRGIEGTHP